MSNNTNDKWMISTLLLAGLFIGVVLTQGYGLLSKKVDKNDYQQPQQVVQNNQQKQPTQNQIPESNKIVDVSPDDDPVLGDKNAPVTIVEFSDFECPFCKKFHQNAFKDIVENYVKTGKVKIVYRDFPLSFHDPMATKEAMAAECIQEELGDEKYFEYSDIMYSETTSNGNGLDPSQLYEFAATVGANASTFKSCLDSEKFKEEIAKDIADGRSYGVNGTPAMFINGKSIVGAQPFSAFQAIIDAELNK